MNINHLRYFLEVCRQENITKASEIIHISQPSLTSAIKYLENELGFRLLDRNRNRICLTKEGRLFRNMLETFMASFDNFYNEALELGQNRKTTLTVGMPAILGSFFFERLIPKFEEANPGIHLTIHETPTLIGLKMIKENLLDLFIGIIEKEDPSYDCKLIFETNLVFWASREHPLASEKVIKGSDLRNQPFIMVPQGSYHFKVISRQYENIPLNVVMHSNQLPTIRYMLKNLAVTILYEQVFENDDAFCKIPLSEPLPAKIGVFWKKNTYLTDAMRAFVRFIKSIQL